MRDWVTNVDDTFYIIGTVAGPHPYPMLVRDFQSVIGREARAQSLKQAGKLPDALVACVGGGSNAIGLFHPFLDDRDVAMYGVEAGGDGIDTGRHAAPLSAGAPRRSRGCGARRPAGTGGGAPHAPSRSTSRGPAPGRPGRPTGAL